MTRVRNLGAGEAIPDGFSTGFERAAVMPEWVWIAESDGPVGVLMAAPCHGLVYMVRICVKKGSNPSVAMALIRACLRDSKSRGFKGYFLHVTTMSGSERGLIPICKKAGGVQLTHPQIVLAGAIEKAVRY